MAWKKDVPAVLARHGIDPNADADALVAALAARGWEARVEERGTGGTGRSPRFRALATRPRSPAEVAAGERHRLAHDHRQAGGRTAEAALGRVLAAVLERGG